MKEIALTRNRVAIVEDADFEVLNKYKWAVLITKTTCYAIRSKRLKGGGKKYYYMHREIMGVTDRRIRVDHIDHNGLNNSRNNLRVCNASQNAANSRSRLNSSSKYLGVFFDKSRNKWAVRITKDYKTINIGRFKTEEEAAHAYNQYAIQVHGAFANINKIA